MMNDLTIALEVTSKIFSGFFLNAGFLIIMGVLGSFGLTWKFLNR